MTKFSLQVFSILQKKFHQTYIVGGAVRNMLLHRKIFDIDIATDATPKQVTKILTENKILFSDTNVKFGVIVAQEGKRSTQQKIEITTLRKDSYGANRYPEVRFVRSPKSDSVRRDFTINALYYSPISGKVLDFHNGLKDIKNRQLKFIGNATDRIKEDPLRIVRAYKFSLQYNLKLETKTANALRANHKLIKKISHTRIEREINSVSSLQLRKKLKKVIHNLT